MPKRPAPYHPEILSLHAYVPGKAKIAGRAQVIKLSSNENPFGASPRAQEALRKAENLHRYPDGSHAGLRAAIAETYGLDAERIVCGVGSDELINLLCDIYAGPGTEVLYSDHGFLMYPIGAVRVGATPVTAAENALKASVDNLLSQVTDKTRMVFIANPNNPTGSYLNKQELERLHLGLPPHVLLVIDNAYAEYATVADYSTGVDLVENHENVVITHTFSKIYGLGGMRIGWCYGPAHAVELLNKIRSPFNLSVAALAMAEAAVRDADFVAKSREHNKTWLQRLSQHLLERGFTVYPSIANFILVDFATKQQAEAVNRHLLEHGIIVRQVEAYKLPGCLRITIGTDAENEAVIKALAEIRPIA